MNGGTCLCEWGKSRCPIHQPDPASAVPEGTQEPSERQALLCDVAQLLDGWHCDVAWTAHDEAIRRRVADALRLEQERPSYTEAEIQWTRWGIIEVAVRNPSVSDYVTHWEGRTLTAEATLTALRTSVEQVKGKWQAAIDAYERETPGGPISLSPDEAGTLTMCMTNLLRPSQYPQGVSR